MSLFGGAESTSNPLYDTLGKRLTFSKVPGCFHGISDLSSLGILFPFNKFCRLLREFWTSLEFLFLRKVSKKTSEYLFTKPHARKEIFLGKSVLLYSTQFTCGWSILSIGVIFTMLLFHAGFDFREFFLISFSLVLLTLFLGHLDY